MTDTPFFKEDHISQIPALQLLLNLGYEYLTPSEAMTARGKKNSQVILETILSDWLKKNNQITCKGKKYEFTETNILNAINSLRHHPRRAYH